MKMKDKMPYYKFNNEKLNNRYKENIKIFNINNNISNKLIISLILGFIIILFIVTLSKNVLALGITPGRAVFDYIPGESHTIDFTVINSEARDTDFVVLVTGELNESIAVSEVSFHMTANEESKKLSYTITMPPNLKPGLNTAEVVVVQLPGKSPKSEAFIGAAVGVATQIHVNVPYPGKYAEADMNVIGPDNEGKITFVIPVISRGELDLVRVKATVDIFSSLNEKITTLTTSEISLPSKQRGEIVATWNTSEVPPGPYRAVATVIYDESTLKIEKQFEVGKRRLEVENIEVNDFTLGEIAKFEILVNNKWSQTISGAYAQMLVHNPEGAIMADFKSATYDIPSLEKILMVAFWDTAGVSKGTYDSSLFLRYGESSEQQDFKLEVKDDEINVIGVGYVISKEKGKSSLGDNTLTVVLITVIVVLIIINVLWFLVLRKRILKKKS